MENTNLTRKQQKIFAGNTTITDEQIAVFGSKTQTGTMTFSKDPDVIQNENWQKGWQNATVLEQAPFEEDFNAISFVNSYNTAYLLQKGIPEYSASTTYFKGSICSIINSSSEPSLYYSLTDNNIGNNPTTDDTNWANLYNYISSLINDNFALIDGSNAEFNNLSTNAKDNIINLAMPDYSAGVSVSYTANTYTAPSGGYFHIWIYGGVAGGVDNIKINNIEVFYQQGSVVEGEYRSLLTFFVNKNDIITWSNASQVQKFIFYPLKGVENA